MVTINDPMQSYATGLLIQTTGALSLQADGTYALVLHASDGAYVRLLLPHDAVTAQMRAKMGNNELRVAWTLESPP